MKVSWHRFVRGYAARQPLGILGCAALVIAEALLLLAVPWPTKLAVDYALRERPLPSWVAWLEDLPGANGTLGLLLWLGFTVVVVTVGSATLKVTYRVWRRSLGMRMTNDLGADVLDGAQRRSLTALHSDGIGSGDLVRRITVDARCVETLVFGVWLSVFQAVVTFVLIGGVVLAMSGMLVLVAIAVAVPIVLLTRVFRERLQHDAVVLADAQGGVATGVEQMLSTLPEIQSFAAEHAELDRFTADADAQMKASLSYQRTSLGFGLSTSAVTALGTGAVMLFGGLRAVNGSLTVGELLVFISYLAAIYSPVEGLAYVTQALANARAGAVRVMPLTAETDRLPELAHPVSLPDPRRGARISFDDVHFSYRDGSPVLRGVNFEIDEGETVAIAGASGAGKSTLVSLVPRLHDPTSGSVRIDGVDARAASLRALRSRVALVRQDPLLLPVSIRDNIRYGSPAADDTRVERAARLALATEFITALPDGFDTVLGQRGVTLSGGQRQRLSIARALCRDAPILILDEPTSALDAESEAAMLDLIGDGASGRTVLIVAHRLSTIRRADRIVVLRNGVVAEEGTHDALRSAGGEYARFVDLSSFDAEAAPADDLVIVLDGPHASTTTRGG